MPILEDGFSRVTINGAQLIEENERKVFHVSTPHALIQSVGYIKHNVAKKGIYGVYFRGQRSVYDSFQPTLYRGCQKKSACASRNWNVSDLIRKIREEDEVLKNVEDYTLEPLLQHYGFKTRWMDVVDNIWIALWFACHRARTWGKLDEYLHFEKRDPEKEDIKSRYAYIMLVSCSHSAARAYQPGCCGNRYSELIDLRYSLPSNFLRPHSQHGLLIRKKDRDIGTAIDFSGLIEGIIRIDLWDALKWLGDGRTFETHSLFPPPIYDSGYQQLLRLRDHGNDVVGAVHHIGA